MIITITRHNVFISDNQKSIRNNNNKPRKMKKALFILAFTLCVTSSATLFAQNEMKESKLKKDIDSLNKIESELTKKEKAFKKELRALESKEVSDFTKKQFKEDFKNIKYVRWAKLERSDEATFLNANGLVSRAYYNDNSELMGTVTIKTFADLPETAQNKINEDYSDYRRILVLYYDDSNMNDAYILLFDEEISEPDTYFVELSKNGSNIVLGFSMKGELTFHKKLSK